MKRRIIIKISFCFVIVLLIGVINCTGQNTQQQFNYKEHVKSRLKLTDNQEDSYWLIMAIYESKKQTLVEKSRDTQDITICQNELIALSNETIKSLEILLTETQLNEWRKFIVEPMPRENAPAQKTGERKFPPDGGPPPGGNRGGGKPGR